MGKHYYLSPAVAVTAVARAERRGAGERAAGQAGHRSRHADAGPLLGQMTRQRKKKIF